MFRRFTALFIVSLWCLFGAAAFAQSALTQAVIDNPNAVVDTQVLDDHKFYGLAGYYNTAFVERISDGKMSKVHDETITLSGDDWLTVVGRYNVLAIQADGLTVTVKDKQVLSFEDTAPLLAAGARVEVVQKPDLKALSPELNQIRYSHLMLPIRLLARLLEAILLFFHGILGSWGFAIIAIAVFLKIVMFPVGRLVKRYQTQVSKTQTTLAPVLANIKATMKGEKAHNATVKAHKDAGVSTFYTLKPMIGLLIQVPIWIAIFNVLAEMPQIAGHGFLWIEDLAFPDAVMQFGTALPLLGDTLNLLPIIMTIVTIASTYFLRDPHAPAAAVRKQKRNLFFMAAGFLILFYPFPAGMVFYWTLANILNFLQQVLTKD